MERRSLVDLRSEVAVVVPRRGMLMKAMMGTSCRLGLGFAPAKGVSIKASCSIAKPSSDDIHSLVPKNLLGSDSTMINGMDDVFSWTSSRGSYVLDGYEDEYGGFIIDPERLPRNADSFSSVLKASLSHWKNQGKKGIWLKLPLNCSELVPIAVKAGFKYHHAEETYVMLTYWIPEEPCLLPANASHQVGVGGFVVNNKNEVLVVQEKHCTAACEGAWKLPTGFILESEEIFNGAIREVKEETGIDTEFIEVIAFRHVHHVAFEKSDLFFICMLRPLSSEIQIDELEILAAKWMPLVEFIEQPLIQSDNMFRKMIDMCIARLRNCYCGLAAHPVISKFDGRSSCLYYNMLEPQDFNCCGS